MGVNVKMKGSEVECYGEITDNHEHLIDMLVLYKNNNKTNLMKYISAYGFTCFNDIQIEDFIPELKSAIRESTNPAHIEIGKKLHKLAMCHIKEATTYLEFYGD